jgi:serine phosphatase RsbU (regulator of sigma subunit)
MEWNNEQGEEFGIARLEESLHSSRVLSAAEVISKLYADVRKFGVEVAQTYDLTVVIIQRIFQIPLAASGSPSPI